MIILNSKHIIFKNTTLSLYIHLRELGIKCILLDKIDSNSNDLHIFIGINKIIKNYPKNYIIYQFEQTDSYYYNDKNEKEYNYFFDQDYYKILENAYQVWDYSPKNIDWLTKNLNLKNILYVPICFCHILKKKMKVENDIDILFFGSLNPKRKKILNLLKNKNIKLIIQNNNCWDEDLDLLIKRSKIIINIHFYENATLEMHRLSYLLTNQCFIISEKTKEQELIHKYSRGIIFCEYDMLVNKCLEWLNKDQAERDIISSTGYKIFKNEKYENYLNKEIYNYPKEENKKKKNKHLINWYIPNDVLNAETVKDEIQNNYILKLPQIPDNELPPVSIITPTGNRRKLFCIAIKNYFDFIYPKNKLEWVIVDDGNEDLSDILTFSKNIKYIKLDISERLPMGKKRNLCVENCKHDFIICMDDDDYYPPESIIARVKTLLKYPNAGCVGCNAIGCYDIFNKKSYLATDGEKYFSEASMGFKKSFWENRKFCDEDKYGENKYFLQYRESEMVNLPFQFIIIAINHNNNITNKIRNGINTVNNSTEYTDLYQMFDFETQIFFNDLIKKLAKEKKDITYNSVTI